MYTYAMLSFPYGLAAMVLVFGTEELISFLVTKIRHSINGKLR